MTRLVIELEPTDEHRVRQMGLLHTRYGLGSTRIMFEPRQIHVSDTLDLEREPQALLIGPRVLATGDLSTAQEGERRLVWDELPWKHREAFRQRQRHRIISRIASLNDDLALIEARMLEEAPK